MAVEGVLPLELVKDAVLVRESLDLRDDVEKILRQHGFGIGGRIGLALPSQVIGYRGFKECEAGRRYLQASAPRD